MQSNTRGTLEMSAAMVISGTIGWAVVRSGQPIVDLLFWRCVFGAPRCCSSAGRWACCAARSACA